MSILHGFGKAADQADSGAAIRVGDKSLTESEETRFGLILVIFMRCLAVLWIFQGLAQWGAVLMPGESVFEHMTTAWGAAVIFFAVLDLVAAVGLWLATPWGGVLWLLAATSQIFVALAMRNFFSTLWIGADVLLILIYFVLTWL
ncbi:MAG TPA: DUF6163 family protein, partial [Beijerinckia sp.]|nr:DUF6163 family protein [Beijerinckia sp.]